MDNQDTERKTDADAPVPEHVHIPNDDTIVTDPVDTAEGVETQSPSVEDVDKSEEPQSMLDAVQKELEGKSSDPASETQPDKAEANDASKPGTGDDDDKDDYEFLKQDVSDDELKNYSQKANARIRQLVEERNAASQQAEQVAPVLDFLQKNDIPQQDLDIVLNLTAQLRHGDFAGFLNGVAPYVDLAQQYTGQKLPPDLHQQVSQGLMSKSAAQELAQHRIQGQLHQQDAQSRDARDHQRDTRERAVTIRNAVTNWEQQKQQHDPDYGLKADLIRRTAQGLMQEKGPAQTVEQAIEYVDQAYKEVNDQMGKIRPQRQATQARPNGSVTKGGTTPRAEPASMLEAAMQGLNAHRG